jgi:glycosyltransferase involved in cell wall biosynthesis
MFTTKGSMSDRLRAAGKFLARDLSGFHSSFRDVLDAMFRRSDAVVCGSETQRDYIKTLCPNCFVILDDHEDSVHRVKTDYRRGEKLNLGWEGMLGNIQPFQSLIPDLKEVLQTQRAQFHVITQLESPRYLRRYGRVQATSVVRQSVPDFPASVYSWSPDTFSSIYTCSDIVLVPLPQGSSFHQAKSASKVLLAARMGLPILCSWSPAYQEFSELAGIPMVCKSASDWADKLQTLSESESMRQAWGEAARKAAESHYSSSLLRGQWKQVLESVRRSP